jgi:predicted MFS family arabinose efflux permease
VLLAQLGTAVAVPILPTLRKTFGVSLTAVALTTSVWGLARLAIDLPVGAITDRIAPGRMLLAGTLLLGSGATLSALAPSFGILLAGRAISGAGSGVGGHHRDRAPDRPERAGLTRAVARLLPGHAPGRLLAEPTVAGFASALLGWQAAFGIAAVSAFAGMLAAWLTGALGSSGPSLKAARQAPPGEAAAHGRAGDGGRVGAGRGRPRGSLAFSLVVVNVATFAIFFTNGALFQNAIPLFGGLQIGLGPAAIGLILSASTLLRFVVGLIGGTLSDRYGRVSVNRFVGDSGLLIGPAVTGVVIDAAGFAPAFWLAAWVAATAAGAVAADQRLNRRVAYRVL